MKKMCSVYRSPLKEGLYLYVDKKEELRRVPEVLLKQFGKPELAMQLLLDHDKPLARTTATKVLDAIASEGFYLQLPPQDEDDLPELKGRA